MTYPTLKECLEKFDEKKEQLAAIEHERWAKWQKYLHSKCSLIIEGVTILAEPGGLIIPCDLVERWERQIKTGYTELSDKEKESDRKEVDSYFPIIESIISSVWSSAYKAGQEDERQGLYNYLISIEARIAKEQIHNNFTNGYFEAIDDVAKHVALPLTAERPIK